MKNQVAQLAPDFLKAPEYQVEVVYTTHAGHATELAQRAVEQQFNVVVAVGGDGSINEIARVSYNFV